MSLDRSESPPPSPESYPCDTNGSPAALNSLSRPRDDALYSGRAEDRAHLCVSEDRDRRRWVRAPETEAERAQRQEAQRERVEETHRKVETGLQALTEGLAQGKSDALLSLLNAMSRFHRYSWGNTILIAFQNPDATLVAGFNAWKQLGRFVKLGERGIAILAPIAKRQRIEAGAGEAEDAGDTEGSTRTSTGSRVRGFRVVYVFDVAQTDGTPLPKFASYRGEPQDALVRLKALVLQAGIRLEYRGSLNGALGLSHGGAISLLCGLSTAQEFHALAHEFGHELLHPRSERSDIPKRVKETEAEAVAYIVSRAIGLEPGTAASDYIQLYQGDSATLAASLDRIQKTSMRILCGLDPTDDAG